jgi:hypothetical protein
MRFRSSIVVLAAALVASCHGCRSCESEEDEQEELDQQRDHFWRARIAIVGAGDVRTAHGRFDCASDGAVVRGTCGPELLRYKELVPPMMRATPAAGWRFDRWESVTVTLDGSTHGRAGPMPDGPLYVNGFGYADTGEVETVTAVFVRETGADAQLGVQP